MGKLKIKTFIDATDEEVNEFIKNKKITKIQMTSGFLGNEYIEPLQFVVMVVYEEGEANE